MKLVRMNGGLGNQVFQYAFLRFVEEKTGEELIIDDTELLNITESKLKNPAHNGYLLDKVFGIKKKRLSEVLDKDVFDYILEKAYSPATEGELKQGIVPLFQESGIDLFVVQEGNMHEQECQYRGSYFSTPMNEFYPDVARFQGDIYFYGYWIGAGYFASIGEKMLKELSFPEIPDEKNRQLLHDIHGAGTNSVALHVRRGDFVQLGWDLKPEMYKRMMDTMRGQIDHPIYFVFSDDIPWVKEHFEDVGLKKTDEIFYVEGNDRAMSYIDMQLMKDCRGMVFSSSSFSYLASLLNTRPDKIVYQPTTRYGINYK